MESSELEVILKMFESLKKDLQQHIDKKLELTQDRLRADLKADIQQEGVKIRKDIQHDMVVLLDTEFKRNYDLLGERLDQIMVKMPSEDDMDIIDGRLSEHDSELKVLRHDVNELKKAL